MPSRESYFANDEHALATGLLCGTLLKAAETTPGLWIVPDTDAEGNYLPWLRMEWRGHDYLVEVKPAPEGS